MYGPLDYRFPSVSSSMMLPPYILIIAHLPFFLALGAFGGIFNIVNRSIMEIRKKYLIKYQIRRWFEVIVVTIFTTVTFFLTVKTSSCSMGSSNNHDLSDSLASYNWSCMFNTTNDLSLLFMGTGEMGVKNLFSSETDLFSLPSLAIYTLVYYLLTMITLGVAAPSGLLVPCLAIGAGYDD